VSDREPQFISTIWKNFNKRLNIKVNLSTAFYSEIDGQTERANQNVEQSLRIYINYMQNDWPRWLPIVEFADNNNRFSSSSLTPFFLNKGFHPRISFCPDQTSYETTKQRLDAAKAENIAMQIKEFLKFAKKRLSISQESIKNQMDRRRKDVTYSLGDWIWLNEYNIKTIRLYKNLKSKYLGLYQIIAVYSRFYKLRLPSTIRIHPVFSPKLLRPCANDPLSD